MKIKIPETLKITNPRWTEKISKREDWEELTEDCTIDGRKLSIGDYGCCIVGEALNLFDESYNKMCEDNYGKLHTQDIDTKYHRGCRECYDFSMNFYDEIKIQAYGENDETDVKSFEVLLSDFAKHLEENHPDIIEEARKNAMA